MISGASSLMNPGVLRVESAGPAVSLQDLGRPGHQKIGVPEGGALDPLALRRANLLVGAEPGCGALEIAYLGPTLLVEADSVRLAIAGAGNLEVRRAGADWEKRPTNRSLTLCAGDRLRFRASADDPLAYLAVEGGFEAPTTLGSVSTYARGGLGGWRARSLADGDALPLRRAQASRGPERETDAPAATRRTFRVLPGPQAERFAPDAFASFLNASYRIGLGANRMAARLDGAPVAHREGFDLTSEGVACGSIQIAGDGQPILLLADRQTTGGYPKIANVVTADLPALAHVPIGAEIRFVLTTPQEALAARRAMMDEIAALPSRMREVRDGFDVARLFESNLISGVADALHA